MKEANTSELSQIAEIVLRHRKKAGLSRRELKVLADVSESAIYNVEKATAEGVRLETLLKLFAVLNIKLKLEGPFVEADDA